MQITFNLEDTAAIQELLHWTNLRNESTLRINRSHGGNDPLTTPSEMAKIFFLFALSHYSKK